MAGFIHIKDEDGFSLGSIAFNAIVEFSRSYFREEDEAIISAIYSPLDTGGFDMVTLNEQSEEGFNAYYYGIKKAYDDCTQKGRCGDLAEESFEMVMNTWKDLLDKLTSDERFKTI